jgi:tyramine---L-glutamate ligase
MRILLYEFITGGGWHLIDSDQPPGGSLLAEGTAMRDALAADLASMPATSVTLLHDPRLPAPSFHGGRSAELHEVASAAEHLPVVLRAAGRASATIVIAPEFDGHLLSLVRSLELAGTKLLSPGGEFVALTSDKHLTAERLAAAGVPVPRGVLLASLTELDPSSPPLPYPAVLKPCDGAGSLGVRVVRQADELPSSIPATTSAWRWEEYLAGRPASVAVLCGARPLPCPACYQQLSDDGACAYLGGRRIEDRRLAQRARKLALRAIAALPATVGYVGIDLILGDRHDGSADAVIEINPRLTTSYVGLRHLAGENLAGVMVANARGVPAELSWRASPIQFESDGTCHQ